MTLLESERTLYADLWSSVEAYGTHAPGAHYAVVFDQMVQVGTWKKRTGDVTVLDAGCGSGKGGVALVERRYQVTLCDLTDEGLTPEAKRLPFVSACLWHDLAPIACGKGHPGRTTFDYVYCCDVLEHIPPQFTMLVIRNLLAVSWSGVFLSISLVPDSFGVWAGTSLHKTVQPFTWWKENLEQLGTVVEARDLLANALFFVRPNDAV